MHLGIGYSTTNTVIDFDDGKRIAWQTAPDGIQGKFFGGRIWRYDLEPADGGTLVRESWDISQEKGPVKHILRLVEDEGAHPRLDGEDAREHREARRVAGVEAPISRGGAAGTCATRACASTPCASAGTNDPRCSRTPAAV